MPITLRLQRRSFFSLAGASLLSHPAPVRLQSAVSTSASPQGTVLATPLRNPGPALNVAGPREGELAALARLLAAPLAAGLMEGGRLDVRYCGGIDGVTGANQFDARAAPDGREALLFPGSVGLDWLTGLRPVRFDGAAMLPLLAAIGPGVLMVNGALPSPGAAPLRLARGAPRDGSLVALLGLDLLGIPAIQIAAGAPADAVFLYGPDTAARATGLAAAGYTPAFSTRPGQTGSTHTPFFLAGLSQERLRDDELVAAWRALAGAAELCAGLVVPRLSPAYAIGRWRHAARLGMEDEAVAARAKGQALHLVSGEDATAALAPMRLGAASRIALARWLARRPEMQPG